MVMRLDEAQKLWLLCTDENEREEMDTTERKSSLENSSKYSIISPAKMFQRGYTIRTVTSIHDASAQTKLTMNYQLRQGIKWPRR